MAFIGLQRIMNNAGERVTSTHLPSQSTSPVPSLA